jgi:hypothetical protein
MWYERINNFLKANGMTRSDNDYNLYHMDEGERKIVLVVYVDDLFVTGGDEQKISWIKN